MNNFINNLIIEAGTIGKQAFFSVLKKKDRKANWVTLADMDIEKYIVLQIKRKFPNHFILTEESYSELPKQIPSHLWIIDPLDGTTNATFGLPIYGISVAYMENGVVKNAAIFDIPNEKLYWAEHNNGSFIDKKQVKIIDSPLNGTLICAGFPYGFDNYKQTSKYFDLIHQAGARMLIVGSAVLASMYTVNNTFSLYYEYGLKIWDVAAVSLIVSEAGGVFGNSEFIAKINHPELFICGRPTAIKEFFEM